MSFGWRDVLNGLDEGLDIAKTIAAIVPGGQGIAIGLGAIDTVVGKANEVYGVKSLPAPIQTSLDILEGVVKAKDNGTGVKVDNNSVIALLEVVSKSTGNDLDDKLVNMIKAYISFSSTPSETEINYNLNPEKVKQYDTLTQATLQQEATIQPSPPVNGETKSGRNFGSLLGGTFMELFSFGKDEVKPKKDDNLLTEKYAYELPSADDNFNKELQITPEPLPVDNVLSTLYENIDQKMYNDKEKAMIAPEDLNVDAELKVSENEYRFAEFKFGKS